VTQELEFANDLIDFIHGSPSPYHVIQNVEKLLASKGVRKLELADRWSLAQGNRYYVTRNGSALIAFAIGNGDLGDNGFRLIAAHTDSPSFKIKPSPEMVVENAYLRLNTEVYGAPILNTWLDRPLGIAGRVSLQGEDPFHPEIRLVQPDRPVLVIPNQSLHMNRQVNEGLELNKQKDMLPLVACVNKSFEKDGFLAGLLAEELGVEAAHLVDFELFLHEVERGTVLGQNDEFISSTRLDDLAMVHAELHAFLQPEAAEATRVWVCYDNEEVGSRTKQGAASPLLRTLLERIMNALGYDREDFFRAIYHSILLSADMGNGLHPNAVDKHDPVIRPVLNGGPMIKVAAGQNFTTDSDTAAVYEALCREAGVPVQRFVSRSDLKGGSTIGPISSSQLDIRSLDVGNPGLAMHSIRELGGVLDHWYIRRSFERFYAAS
jgi:aspartyl aminopeptidase